MYTIKDAYGIYQADDIAHAYQIMDADAGACTLLKDGMPVLQRLGK